ncbi:hypothetical protein NT01EI_3925 [Edwardsiella ictaluri 93-146]|uniref:Uncharacterized protein n=1 Tax=Edwardsiella ictaluri (strain 93-146) TaxID=634503 RepID=C5BF53_EDWI9|nr:hypothetical protein NT01EI_3925 [Edwardsiella ictaluri 93-146]
MRMFVMNIFHVVHLTDIYFIILILKRFHMSIVAILCI